MNASRRGFLTAASATGLTAFFGARFCRAVTATPLRGPFKRCLVLWMEGGPSQLDTFDPDKRGDPNLSGGRRSIPTNLSGVRFSETLPRLSERADELCLVRSVGSREGEHARASELMHTGFSPQPSFPRPAMGAMIAHDREDPGFPRYVTLGGEGFGPAFLGSEHGPFVIEDLEGAKSQLARVEKQKHALDLVGRFNRNYAQSTHAAAAAERSSAVDAVRRLLETRFPESLNPETAPSAARDRYGDHAFGRRVLTARRLLSLGVPFVEAQLGNWDTPRRKQASYGRTSVPR